MKRILFATLLVVALLVVGVLPVAAERPIGPAAVAQDTHKHILLEGRVFWNEPESDTFYRASWQDTIVGEDTGFETTHGPLGFRVDYALNGAAPNPADSQEFVINGGDGICVDFVAWLHQNPFGYNYHNGYNTGVLNVPQAMYLEPAGWQMRHKVVLRLVLDNPAFKIGSAYLAWPGAPVAGVPGFSGKNNDGWGPLTVWQTTDPCVAMVEVDVTNWPHMGLGMVWFGIRDASYAGPF